MIDFDKFYREQYGYKVGLVRKFFKTTQDEASDIVQEAFVRALTYQKGYKSKLSSVNTWFNTILFNVARSNKPGTIIKEFKETQFEAEEEFDRKEISRKILVYTVNDKHIRILKLFYISGYTSREISSILGGVSISNVTTICNRFKEFLMFNDSI